jgi:hypothetical protein
LSHAVRHSVGKRFRQCVQEGGIIIDERKPRAWPGTQLKKRRGTSSEGNVR